MDEDLDDLHFDFDNEDDDMLLAGAVDEASIAALEADGPTAGPSEHNHDDDEDLVNISLGIENACLASTQQCDVSGFDRTAGQLWIYPTNYPVRDYQYNIVQQALHRNTLVVLPTGLGKTFIAAVVMYNMYRWFPQGKVVFMAPTKPLVAQQINACYTIVGIPKEDTVEMTGNMNPTLREQMWRQKRVIFLTPQVMTNDLSRGSFSATNIKCLVVDEAHKAVGNHAYCQVVQGLLNFNQEFRVLALSATPGSDLKGVQQVMCNLLIAHIELRSEESIDIRPYTHERKVDKVVVPMGEELSGIQVKYLQIIEMIVDRLTKQRVLYRREVTKLSKFLILKARDEYRQNPPSHIQGAQCGLIEADFATAMSLYHGLELLQLHGLRSLYNFLLGLQSGDKGYGRTRYDLCRHPTFIEIMEELQEKFALKRINGPGQGNDTKMAVGHPKMQRLEEIVVEHFKSFHEKNMDTRVMIFSQYRDSVEEIRNILNQHHPLVKVMMFIGQSSVGKATKGYTQKEQLEVMRQFREGGYNTLVSTCVGEEGLDIGDVDLIVCFDAHKSPIRLVQRMGRTGRKRTGRIVMLVTKGKEEQIYNQSLYSKKSIHKAIVNGAKTLHFYPHNPPLIPPDIKPKCHKMHITVKATCTKPKVSTSAKAKSKKPFENGNDISTAFGKARSKQSSSELSNAEYEEIKKEFCQVSKTAKHLPRPKCSILSKNREMEDYPKDRPLIDLSEWTPWQNRLQPAHLIGHSSTTHNLVQTCEFIELQQSIGEDAHGYSIEMRKYVNKADVMQSSFTLNQSVANVSGQCSIKSFFSSSQNSKQGEEPSRIDSQKGVEISNNSKKGKVNGGQKKSKTNGMSKSSGSNISRASNRSALFTSILPVTEKQDGSLDIEMIDLEAVSEVNEKSVSPQIHSRKDPIQKKKGSKKKLLDNQDLVWRDEPGVSGKHGNKVKRQPVSNVLQSNLTFGGSDCNEELGMGVENEYVFHTKVKKKNPHKELSDGNEDLSVFLNSKSPRSKRSPSKIDFWKDDAIEVEDSEQEVSEENGICTPGRCLNDICIIPSPPRVEEVAEIFNSLESPIDFTSLDVYELVRGWDKIEENYELLKTSFDSSTLTAALAQKKNLMARNRKPGIDEKFSSVVKSDENKNSSPVKLASGLQDEQCEVGKGESSKTISRSISGLSGNVMPMSKSNQQAIIHVESDDDVQNIPFDIHVQPSSQSKSDASKLNLINHATHSYPTSKTDDKEPQPCSDSSVNTKLFVDIAHSPASHQPETYREPSYLSDSMNDVMGAMDFDDHLFSPPSAKKKASQGKLVDTHSKNLGVSNISMVTYSQALGYLHSSSSESMLSPTNTRTDSSILSPLRKNEINKSNRKLFTNLKSTHSFSVSSVHKEDVPCDVLMTGPEFEKCVDSKTSEIDTAVQESRQNLDLSPHNLEEADLDEFGFDDEWCASDIIPPTPPKNNSVRTKVAPNNSQTIPNKYVSSKTLSTLYQHDHSNTKQPLDETTTTFNNSHKGSRDDLNPLQCIENAAVQSKSKCFDSIRPLSQISSSNEENIPIPLQNVKNSDNELKAIDNDEDCIILSPPSKNQKLPFDSYKDTACIEIFDSQSEQQPLLDPHTKSHERCWDANKGLNPLLNDISTRKRGNPADLDNHPYDRIEIEDSDQQVLEEERRNEIDPGALPQQSPERLTVPCLNLCNTKKKKLSLKATNGNSFDEDCYKRKNATIMKNRGIGDLNASSLNKSITRGINASTPLTKVKGLSAKLLSASVLMNDIEGDDGVDGLIALEHLTPIKRLTSTPNVEQDEERSFTIRRKRKPAAALDSSSDSESGIDKQNEWLCAKKKSEKNESKDSKKNKSKSFEDWQAECLDGVDDDDDFEEMEMFSKGKQKPTERKAGRKSKSVKVIRKRAGFVEDEADVSGDDSSDEEEGIGDDCYEGSFINNDTEITPTQADQTDMRAVYLKSVKSPVHGKYKLQFNNPNNMDIFSQAMPASQGLSEYEEDSFCVGSDEEESPIKKSKKKSHKNRKDKNKHKEINNKKRRVVCRVSSSSSEEGNDNGFPFTQEATTNQRAIAQKALMSSSDDNEDEINENRDDYFTMRNEKRNANVLDDTDYGPCDFAKAKLESHLYSSSAFDNTKNQSIQNINRKKVLPDLDSDSVARRNTPEVEVESNINTGAKATDIITFDDDWMDDFDAAALDFDPYTLKSQRAVEEETQAPSCVERLDSDYKSTTRNTGLNDMQGSSKHSIQFEIMCGRSTANHSEGNKHFNTSYADARPSNTIAHVKPFSHFSSKGDDNNSLDTCTNYNNTIAGNRDIAREERLKRQKERQEQYKQKLANMHQQHQFQSVHPEIQSLSKSPAMVTTQNSFAKPSPLSSSTLTSFSKHKSPAVTPQSPSTSFASNSSNISVNTTTALGAETLQVLVDTREVSGAQDVISALRLKHNVTVTAKQLAACDYVLSNHLVVDRMYWSAFSNGSNRSKLASRLCEMQTLYGKCAIIIETDKVKVRTGPDKSRKVTHTKYTDKTMALVIQTGVKMYFSDSPEQTASLLFELCQAEKRKGRHLTAPAKLNPKKEGMFNFIMSIPQINIMEALNLTHNYKNLVEMVTSPAAVLQKRGYLSSEKVQWLYNYLRHSFDPQMLPSTYR